MLPPDKIRRQLRPFADLDLAEDRKRREKRKKRRRERFRKMRDRFWQAAGIFTGGMLGPWKYVIVAALLGAIALVAWRLS